MKPNAYNEIPYVSRPFRQTHPERIAAIARLFGVPAADPLTARVLDIGCGEGGNLVPMALAMPEARFHGFDLAEAPVARANERIRQLGLTNIRIEALDLLEFPEDAGEFDYILAHGFYSWVPDAVREAYLRLLQRHLSPNGIAYVSFNAYPGAMLRHPWRDGAAFHTAVVGANQDANTRLAESCRMLEWMAAAQESRGAWTSIVGEMVDAVRNKGANWAAHDDFGPVFQPFYFHQVAQAAADHGLQYLSDAVYSDTLPHNVIAEVRQILQGLEGKSTILREQYYDFIELRPFRQCLFCRDHVGVQRPAGADALRQMHFSTSAEVVVDKASGDCTVRHPQSGQTIDVPAGMRRILQELRLAWPCSVPFSQVAIAENDRAKVAELLLQLYGVALLEVHTSPQLCGTGMEEKPRAWALCRLEAASGQPVTTRIHTQGQMDEVSIRLIRKLDGQTSRAQLAAEFDDLASRLRWLANLGILDPVLS